MINFLLPTAIIPTTVFIAVFHALRRVVKAHAGDT